MKSKFNLIVIALIPVVVYQLMKFWVYEQVPVTNFEDWVLRDTIMDGPRLLVGLLALLFYRRWCTKPSVFEKQDGRVVTSFITILLFLFLIFMGFIYPAGDICGKHLIVIGLSSFIVAFHEEIVFRGLLMSVLGKLLKNGVVINVIQAVIFMAFHYKAQELTQFPQLFVFGLIFGILRQDGMSLWHLVFIHGVYDAAYFAFRSGGPSDEFSLLDFLFVVGILLSYLWFRHIYKPSTVVGQK